MLVILFYCFMFVKVSVNLDRFKYFKATSCVDTIKCS